MVVIRPALEVKMLVGIRGAKGIKIFECSFRRPV